MVGEDRKEENKKSEKRWNKSEQKEILSELV